MFALSSPERLELASHVKRVVGERGVVVATGTYGGSIEAQASSCNDMARCCDAVVVNTATLADVHEDDAAWKEAASRLLQLTGDVPLGLYECPVPYKRLLSPELIGWCASTGRFHFHKDTSCNMSDIRAKLARVKASPCFRFYNANVETLAPSLAAGAHGFSGISANFYPHLHAFLCRTAREALAMSTEATQGVEDVDDEAAEGEPMPKRLRGTCVVPAPGVELDAAGLLQPLGRVQRVQDFLSLAEATVCVRYPQSAKVYLREAGCELGIGCRHRPDGTAMVDAPWLEHQLAALHAMR